MAPSDESAMNFDRMRERERRKMPRVTGFASSREGKGVAVLALRRGSLAYPGTKKPTAPPPIKQSAPHMVTIFAPGATLCSPSVLRLAGEGPMLIGRRRGR